jgi:hypothetical protein
LRRCSGDMLLTSSGSDLGAGHRDQDCLQLLLREEGELPSNEQIRSMLTLGRTSNFSSSRDAHGNGDTLATFYRSPQASISNSGRVCVLPHAVVAPPLPTPHSEGATTSGLLSPDHASQRTFNKHIQAVLRGAKASSTRSRPPLPFGLHATQTWCQRGAPECTKASLMAPLRRAEASIYSQGEVSAVDKCVLRTG